MPLWWLRHDTSRLLYLRHYRERIVSGRIVRNLVAHAYDLEDGASSQGRDRL